MMVPKSNGHGTMIRIWKEIQSHHQRTGTSALSTTVSGDGEEQIDGEGRGEGVRCGVDGA